MDNPCRMHDMMGAWGGFNHLLPLDREIAHLILSARRLETSHNPQQFSVSTEMRLLVDE